MMTPTVHLMLQDRVFLELMMYSSVISIQTPLPAHPLNHFLIRIWKNSASMLLFHKIFVSIIRLETWNFVHIIPCVDDIFNICCVLFQNESE